MWTYALIISLLIQQTLALPYASTISQALSIAGLALAVLHFAAFKTHFRGLEFLQLSLLFSAVNGLTTFADGFDYSVIQFNANFFTPICSTGDFTCTTGFPLPFAACYVAAILIVLLVVQFEKRRRPELRFANIYVMFKGLIRWFYITLAYVSSTYIIMYLKQIVTGQITNFIAPIIVAAVLVVFPIAQVLIYYFTETQEEKATKLKWIEFMELFRVAAVAVLISVYTVINSQAYYGVYVVLGIYFVLYMIFNKFDHFTERIVFAITESANITIFSLYLWIPNTTTTNDIDSYIIIIVFGIEVLYQIVKVVFLCKQPKISADQKQVIKINSFEQSAQNFEAVPITTRRQQQEQRNHINKSPNFKDSSPNFKEPAVKTPSTIVGITNPTTVGKKKR